MYAGSVSYQPEVRGKVFRFNRLKRRPDLTVNNETQKYEMTVYVERQ